MHNVPASVANQMLNHEKGFDVIVNYNLRNIHTNWYPVIEDHWRFFPDTHILLLIFSLMT